MAFAAPQTEEQQRLQKKSLKSVSGPGSPTPPTTGTAPKAAGAAASAPGAAATDPNGGAARSPRGTQTNHTGPTASQVAVNNTGTATSPWGMTGGQPTGNSSSGGPAGAVGTILDPAGVFKGGTPSSYDAQGNLQLAQQQSGAVYDRAMGLAAADRGPMIGPAIRAGDVDATSVQASPYITGSPADALRKQQLGQIDKMANAPSAATAQMKANLGQIANAQQGAAAAARGADRGAAKRDALLGTGTAAMGAANSTAALAAQEEQAKQSAVSGALAGVRQGDVAIGSTDLAAQQANQRAELEAAEARQRGGLTADQANAQNHLQAYQLGTQAQLGYMGAATQATGAGTQAAGVASNYGISQNQAATAQKSALIGGGASLIGAMVSDERVKQSIGSVGGGSEIGTPYSTGAPSSPYGGISYNYGANGQDFLDWTPKAPEAKQSSGGLLGGILSDEKAKRDVFELGRAMGKADATSGPAVRDVTPETLENSTPLWGGGFVKPGDTVSADQKAAESMDDRKVRDWASAINPITYRYKPGMVAGDDGRPRLGVSANELEQTGPLGRMLVHRDPETGLRTVDYGAGALLLSKTALQAAEEALAEARRRGKK